MQPGEGIAGVLLAAVPEKNMRSLALSARISSCAWATAASISSFSGAGSGAYGGTFDWASS